MRPHYTVPGVARDMTMANTMYNRIQQGIKDEEEELSAGQALAVTYSTPANDLITVTGIGYHNPNLIYLFGHDSDGKPATVMLHMSAVQLVMKRVAASSDETKRQIGFIGPVGSSADKS